MRPSSVLCAYIGMVKMLPRTGRSIRRPDGDRHSSVSKGVSSAGQLVQQVGGLGDHRVRRVDRTGVVLQRADTVDEPAVIRSALGARVGRVESAAGMPRVVGGHQNTVLPGVGVAS